MFDLVSVTFLLSRHESYDVNIKNKNSCLPYYIRVMSTSSQNVRGSLEFFPTSQDFLHYHCPSYQYSWCQKKMFPKICLTLQVWPSRRSWSRRCMRLRNQIHRHHFSEMQDTRMELKIRLFKIKMKLTF